jgi:hypothetical protein
VDIVPIELAFTRLGADVAGQQRPVWATAQDGSLVLVCKSSGFTRPAAGVLRYSAKLSLSTVRASQVDAMRVGLGAASSGGTPVRLIIHTQGVNGASNRVHVRADLVGSVVEFDGDSYSVDFVRLPEAEPEPVAPSRRKR